ncbi:von Willebrand factor [Tanacetum coccineum]
MREKKKEETRAHNAQLHVAVSIAGVGADVATIAAAIAAVSATGKDEQMAKTNMVVSPAATLACKADIFAGLLLQTPSLHDHDQRDMFCFYLFPGSNINTKVFDMVGKMGESIPLIFLITDGSVETHQDPTLWILPAGDNFMFKERACFRPVSNGITGQLRPKTFQGSEIFMPEND